MARDNTVNTQVSDAVAETAAQTVGAASGQTMAMLDAVATEALGMTLHNAAAAQRNMQMLAAACVTSTCARMLSVPVPKAAPPKPSPGPSPSPGPVPSPSPIWPMASASPFMPPTEAAAEEPGPQAPAWKPFPQHGGPDSPSPGGQG